MSLQLEKRAYLQYVLNSAKDLPQETTQATAIMESLNKLIECVDIVRDAFYFQVSYPVFVHLLTHIQMKCKLVPQKIGSIIQICYYHMGMGLP